MWGVVLLTIVALTLRLPPRLVALPLTMTMAYVILAVSTTVHELGHAGAALAMRIRVRGIALGTGPQLIALRRLRFTLSIHLIPFGGMTSLEPPRRALRSRHIAVTIAGPALETAAVLTAIALVPSWLGWLIGYVWAFSFIGNVLLPLRWLGNDAWTFWRLLTMPDEEIGAIAETAAHDRDARLLNDMLHGIVAVDVTVVERIRGDMLARSAMPGNDPGMRALTLSNLAAIDLVLERGDLLAEADRASAEAMAVLPWVPEVASTRGSVLVALGHDTAARQLLEQVLAHAQSTAKEAAHANLALLAARRGDAFQTRLHLTESEPVAGLPAYRAAFALAGELELQVVLRYWHPGRDAASTALAIRGDAGSYAAMIGRALSHLVSSRDRSELERMLEHVRSGQSDGTLTVDTVASIAAHLAG